MRNSFIHDFIEMPEDVIEEEIDGNLDDLIEEQLRWIEEERKAQEHIMNMADQVDALPQDHYWEGAKKRK